MKKIILLMILVLLITPLVSAADWDNILDYSNDDLKVTLRNSILWIFPTSEIGTAELKSHSSVNEIRKVGLGNQIVMWYDFNFVELYLNGLGEIEFTDMRTGKEIERDYSFVYWGETERDVYGLGNCFLSINGTQTCESIVVGKETYETWLPYNSKDIPKGNIRIGLMAYVEINDKVDGVWTIVGRKIDRHAVWNANAIKYADFENGAINRTESDGITWTFLADANDVGTPEAFVSTTNPFNGTYSLEINSSGTNYGGVINRTLSEGAFTNHTISIWTNSNKTGHSGVLNFWSGTNKDGTYMAYMLQQLADCATGRICTYNGSWMTSDYNYVANTWVRQIIIVNSSGTSFYLNNDSALITHTPGVTSIGTYTIQSKYGYFDDIAICPGSDFDCGIGEREGLIITLLLPEDTTNFTTNTISFSANVSDPVVLGIQNVSLLIDGAINQTNSSGIEGFYNWTTNLNVGDYNWTVIAYDDADDLWETETRDFIIRNSLERLFTFNASSFETDTETFFVNITTNSLIPTNGKLIYNGTSHTATVTNTAGDNYNISATIDIPPVAEIKPFFFNYTIDGIETNTTTQTQIINLTNFTFCLEGMTYMNITFKNETIAEELVTAQIDADWTYWLGGGNTFKTLTHTNVSENLNYTFCLEDGAQNMTLNTNLSTTYDNSISEQRSFSSDFILNNDTTNLTLFLLPTVEGVFITFQVVTVAEQVISGVDINVTKSSVIIETGITDAAGLKTFFLDPDTTYGFSFFKSGFDVFTTSLAPTQTTFTVTLGSVAGDVINDTTKGISYFINPIANVLDNNTDVEFNLTFVSSFWALDNFSFFLKNSTGNFFNHTSSSTDTGGFLTQTLNTGNNTDLIMEITWTINGNQTNVTRTWIVRNFADEGFSIKTFFDDLSTYLTSNMFGLTSFGLGIIIFLIITLITGVLSVKFGITSPPGIAIIVFTLVAFFDVALGIMPNPVNAVPNFPTIFMGIIFLGTFIKEAIVR